MIATTLTSNFHPQAGSAYPLSLCILWARFLTVVIVCISLRCSRSVLATSWSLSLENIDYGPVLLGVVMELLVMVLVPVVTILLFLPAHAPSGGSRILWVMPAQFFIFSVLGYGIAGLLVWLTARQNKCGNVIFTTLISMLPNVLCFIYLFCKRPHFSGIFSLLLNLLLIAATFILGARLAQRMEESK